MLLLRLSVTLCAILCLVRGQTDSCFNYAFRCLMDPICASFLPILTGSDKTHPCINLVNYKGQSPSPKCLPACQSEYQKGLQSSWKDILLNCDCGQGGAVLCKRVRQNLKMYCTPATEIPTTKILTTEILTTEVPSTITTEFSTSDTSTTEVPTTDIPAIPDTEPPTTEFRIATTEILATSHAPASNKSTPVTDSVATTAADKVKPTQAANVAKDEETGFPDFESEANTDGDMSQDTTVATDWRDSDILEGLSRNGVLDALEPGQEQTSDGNRSSSAHRCTHSIFLIVVILISVIL